MDGEEAVLAGVLSYDCSIASDGPDRPIDVPQGPDFDPNIWKISYRSSVQSSALDDWINRPNPRAS